MSPKTTYITRRHYVRDLDTFELGPDEEIVHTKESPGGNLIIWTKQETVSYDEMYNLLKASGHDPADLPIEGPR